MKRGVAIAVAITLVVYLALLWTQKWIGDDGYIYLAYAKNLFDHGELTYNLGEQVDAATGFAWLIGIIASKGVLFFLDLRQATFVLSWACVLWAFAAIARRALAGEARFLIALPALFLTRFIVSFSTSGLETPAILLIAVLVYMDGRDRLRAPRIAVLLGIAPFVRPELGILTLFYAAFLAWKRDLRTLGIAAATLFGLAVARWLCFGDVLPNTAFIKLSSKTFGQGRWYFLEFFASYLHVTAIFVALLGVCGWMVHAVVRRRRLPDAVREHHVFALASVLALLAYIYASGGDFMHGRFFVAPFALTTLLVVDLGAAYAIRMRPRWQPPALLAAAAVIALVAVLGSPYTTRSWKNYFHKIGDEQVMTMVDNPRLSAWGGVNPHRWAQDGRRLERLARRVGRPIGVSVGGIGAIAYYSDAARVYVFDDLSLTRVIGSMLDTDDYYRRIGHNMPLPEPLKVLEPRLTLLGPIDGELVELVRFRFEETDFILGALRDIDAYVAAGLLPADTWAKVDARVAAILDDAIVDRNVVFFLRHRYPDDRPLAPRIRAAYDRFAADGSRSWITWYESQRELIERAGEIQRGERAALPARYAVYAEHGMRPIATIYQQHSWAVPEARRCPLALAKAKSKAAKGIAARWQGERLTLSNSADDTAWLDLDLAPLIASCGGTVEEIVVDWVVREVEGEPLAYFVAKPLPDKQRFYLPGPPLREVVDPAKPPHLAFPVLPGQRFVLDFEAYAIRAP